MWTSLLLTIGVWTIVAAGVLAVKEPIVTIVLGAVGGVLLNIYDSSVRKK